MTGLIDTRMLEICQAKIPLEVQIFLWMAWHDRVKTAQQLRKRKWDGSKQCKYCGKEETVDHLLFQCPAAMVTWCWVRDSLSWPRIPTPITSFQDICVEVAASYSSEFMWWIVAAVGWALWKSRNDLVFSNIIDKSPKQVAYRVFGFLKQWLKLSKEDARSKDGGNADEDEGRATNLVTCVF